MGLGMTSCNTSLDFAHILPCINVNKEREDHLIFF